MRLMIGVITNIVTGRVLEEGKGEDHGLQEEIVDQEAGIEDLDLDPDLEVVDIKILFYFFIFYFYHYHYYFIIIIIIIIIIFYYFDNKE